MYAISKLTVQYIYNLDFIIVCILLMYAIAISLRNNTRIAIYIVTERITDNIVLQIKEFQLQAQR